MAGAAAGNVFKEMEQMARELQRERSLREAALSTARRSLRDRDQLKRVLDKAGIAVDVALSPEEDESLVLEAMLKEDQAAADDAVQSEGVEAMVPVTTALPPSSGISEADAGAGEVVRNLCNQPAVESAPAAVQTRVEEVEAPKSPPVDAKTPVRKSPPAERKDALSSDFRRPPRPHASLSMSCLAPRQEKTGRGGYGDRNAVPAAPLPTRRALFKAAPTWEPNAPICSLCQAGFSLLNGRHHCRQCGKNVCGACSPFRVALETPLKRPASPFMRLLGGGGEAASAAAPVGSQCRSATPGALRGNRSAASPDKRQMAGLRRRPSTPDLTRSPSVSGSDSAGGGGGVEAHRVCATCHDQHVLAAARALGDAAAPAAGGA
eukprot:TRINITY_DN6430_c0_g2_i1.p1 TRINITY_DN6430_c0_g2~~TRINITY_DN6430_c0_g2_i1.p1  ORF type:complete len:378 (+),score=86.78 TRINITY_DN6430_c0_g2_i1:97-1230(+)